MPKHPLLFSAAQGPKRRLDKVKSSILTHLQLFCQLSLLA